MGTNEIRETIELTNEGTKIFGVLHRPIGESNAPVVVFFHGLAGHKVGKHRMYVLLAEALSSVGIASFRFDFRGSGDSEGDFGEMSIKGEVSDALCAIDFVRKQPGIDSSRLGVFARSFGGAVAIYASSARKDLVKSIALWAPVYDGHQWEELWELARTQEMDEAKRHELMLINGQLPSVGFYQELFAMNLEERMASLDNIPLLLIHGEKDPIVNIGHSELYLKARQQSSKETSFVKLPHSDHDFTHPDEKRHAIHLTCKWFAKTLE